MLNYDSIFTQKTLMLMSFNLILPTTDELIAFALKIIYNENNLYNDILKFLIFSGIL